MAKDYAQKADLRRANKKAAGVKKFSYSMWFLVAGLLGCFAGGLWWLSQHPHHRHARHVHTIKPITKKPHKVVKKPAGPKFEFYTLLPKMKVPTEKINIVSDAKSSYQPKFLIQVASFKSYTEADTLKARLIMQGYNVLITGTGHHNSWYRVRVGPFAAKTSAEQSLQKLHQSKYPSAMIVAMR